LESFFKKVNQLSKKLSIIIIITIVIITGVTSFLSSKLSFDYDFEHFFPENDPDLAYFLEFRETYENDNDYMLIAIVNNEGVFDADFLQKATHFSNELKKLNHIEKVISPTQLQQPIFNSLGFMEVPLLHVDDTSKYKNDQLRIEKSTEYNKTLFAEDFNSMCIVIHNQQIITKKASDELLNNIESLIRKYNFDDVHYVGKIRGQKIYLTKMKKELIFFLSLSIFLVVLLLWLSFKSVFGILIPILTVFISIMWTLGIMHYFGKSIDVMTTLLPTILFVVGMSDAVHIINKYLEELRNGQNKMNAIRITFREIGWATLLTSLTTAVGFITLIMINIQPIKEFGLYTALGVILAFIITILFLPALLSLLNEPKITQNNHLSELWRKTLSRTFLITIQHPKKILCIYASMLVIAIIGLSQLEINYHLLEDLSEKEPLQQDFRFFENHYSGIRPFEMTISTVDSNHSIFDYSVIREMDKVDDYLHHKYQSGFMFSPITVVKAINKAIHGGSSNYYNIPTTESDYQKVIKKLEHPSLKKMLNKIVRIDNKECRFSGKMDDIGSKKANELNAQLKSYFNENINTNLIQYKMTGTAFLIDKNNELLALNIIKSLSIAFLLIAIIAGFVFWSINMAFISLIPNIIPLTVVGGLMGFLGHSINISTSIIFTIAFGIAVDDTIHFLSRFKIEQNKQRTFFYALKRAYLSTGKAIVLTTLILCGGFLSLIFSDFKSIYLIGLYISTTLLIAVTSDLFLLPALLILFKRKL